MNAEELASFDEDIEKMRALVVEVWEKRYLMLWIFASSFLLGWRFVRWIESLR